MSLFFRTCGIFLLLIVTATSINNVVADEATWEYLSAYGGTGTWQIRKFQATVYKNGRSIIIKVYSKGIILEQIIGTLTENKLTALRHNMASEPQEEPIYGTFSQIRDGEKLYEIFSLSNEYSFIGVSRSIENTIK